MINNEVWVEYLSQEGEKSICEAFTDRWKWDNFTFFKMTVILNKLTDILK